MDMAKLSTKTGKRIRAILWKTKDRDRECQIKRLNYLNGKTYKGSFFEDKPHGNGEVSHPDGSLVVGFWEKGRFTQGHLTQTKKTKIEF